MATPIAEFYGSVGLRIRRQDLRRVDQYFNQIERRLRRFQRETMRSNLFGKNGLTLSKFNVNQMALRKTLGIALDDASRRVTFEVSRFAVNERNLRASLIRASRTVGREGLAPQRGFRGGYVEPPPQARRGYRGNEGMFGDARNLMYAGGGAGLIARSGLGVVPFIGGVYGISALNRANQEIFTTPLTTQAVVQSYGYDEQAGKDAFGWLKNQGNEIGFSYMDAAPDFNQMLSNALGAGIDIEGTQELFKGFNEYQTAMSVTPYRRKLVNNA